MDNGKKRGRNFGSNRDEDVEENKRSHTKGQGEKWEHQKGVTVCDIKREGEEIRMRWYGHVMRMEEVMNSVVAGRRPKGRPKRWKIGRTT